MRRPSPWPVRNGGRPSFASRTSWSTRPRSGPLSDRTRLVLLNTPHNPTGKVFTRAELELVAALARQHDARVVTDEVYEHLVFDDAEHIPMATLPGMAERTITISSAGKTFSATGWKVGWLTGPAEAVAAARTVKQFLTYVGSGLLQPAVAVALGLGDEVYADLASALEAKRDLLCDALRGAWLKVPQPRGTYFVVADAARLGAVDALEFARGLPERGWRGRRAGFRVPRRPGGCADSDPVRPPASGTRC